MTLSDSDLKNYMPERLDNRLLPGCWYRISIKGHILSVT